MTGIPISASGRHKPDKPGLRLKLLALSLILLTSVGLTKAAGPGNGDRDMQGGVSRGHERPAPSLTPQAFDRGVVMAVAGATAKTATNLEVRNSEARNIKFSKGGCWPTRSIGLARLTLPAEQRKVLPAQTGGDEPVGKRLFISGF